MRSRRLLSLGLALFTAAASLPATAAPPPGASPPAPASAPASASAPAAAPAAAPASASAPDPASAASTAQSPGDRAAQFYKEGNALYDQGKYKEAEAKYQAAWDIQQSFDVAGNLGNAEMLIGQPRDAAEHLSYALHTFPLGGTPEKKKFLQDRLIEAKQQIGTLRIKVNVDRAEILIDGKRIGESPLLEPVFVLPGERNIVVRRGALKVTKSILVAKGSSQDLSVTLDAGPKPAILIAGGAVAGAGIISGVVFALLSNGKASDGDAIHDQLAATGGEGACTQAGNQARCDELLGVREDQALLANVSAWSFIGGGLALVGTGVYWLVTASEPAPIATPSRGLRAVPVVTAQGAGLMLGGSF